MEGYGLSRHRFTIGGWCSSTATKSSPGCSCCKLPRTCPRLLRSRIRCWTPGVASAGEPSPSPRPRCSVSSRGSRPRRTSARRHPPSPPWRRTNGVHRARQRFADDAPVYVVFLADCRAYMSPPVPNAYAGNCVALCTASLSGSVLSGPDGPARALLAVREAVAEAKRDPLRDRARWLAKFMAIPPGRAVVLVGSPWFPAYGLDFGFGRPARVELESMNNDGEMVLVAGREAGSVQASVAIAAGKMLAFRDKFMVE
ncbi:hypothetical protein ZWY2020_014234 [Hordeum vulgare]|nr:hypothetical protein ZWY2020_014234 [Hordeum vulgare]